MPIALSTYYENFQVYDVRKAWRQLQLEGYDIARSTVARVMRAMGLQGSGIIREWVDWFNNCRLLEPIGSTPPAEAEERYYAILDVTALTAQLNEMASGKPGAVQIYKQCTDKRPVASVFYGSNTASSDSKCDCESASGYILREMHSGGHLRRKWLEIRSSGEGRGKTRRQRGEIAAAAIPPILAEIYLKTGSISISAHLGRPTMARYDEMAHFRSGILIDGIKLNQRAYALANIKTEIAFV